MHKGQNCNWKSRSFDITGSSLLIMFNIKLDIFMMVIIRPAG